MRRPQKKHPRPAKRPARPAPRALVPRSVAVDFDRVDGTGMFDTLDHVRALPAEEAAAAIVCRSVAKARGYEPRDLFAIADIGRHYLESGGYRLAQLIFEGLVAIDPDEPYFQLALGLTCDHLDDKPAAMRCYRRAQKLDPADPRPDLNLAELLVESGDRRRAVRLIRRARDKANRTHTQALADKAEALLSLLQGAA